MGCIPTFRITVTLEDAGLAIQATGQPRFPVFAESETSFFLKVVEAQVEFVVLEKCGHFWHECPEAFFAHVRAFFDLPPVP